MSRLRHIIDYVMAYRQPSVVVFLFGYAVGTLVERWLQ